MIRRAQKLTILLALYILATSCLNGGNSKKSDKSSDPLVRNTVLGGGSSSFGPSSTAIAFGDYIPPSETTVTLWKSELTVPAEALDVNATLMLELLRGGLSQSPDLMLVSPLVRFTMTTDESIVARSQVKRNIRVKTVVDRIVSNEDLIVLLIENINTSEQKLQAFKPKEIKIEEQADRTKIISFEMRDPHITFAVAASTKGALPAGYSWVSPPPPEASNLQASAASATDEGSQALLSWRQAGGSRAGYMVRWAASDKISTSNCLTGKSIDQTLIKAEQKLKPQIFIEESTVIDELTENATITFQLCTTNDRVPPDISPGITTTYAMPRRAKAVLSGLPASFSNVPDLAVTVGGDGIIEYRYALVTGAEDCAAATYSDWLPIATEITDTVSGDGEKKLCVLGKKSEENLQKSATAYTWTFDTTPPGTFVINAIPTPQSNTAPELTWDAADEATLYSAVIASDVGCTVAVQTFDDDPDTGLTPDILSDGTYYLCVTARDEAGNTTPASNTGYQFEIDTTAPVFTAIDLINDAADQYINTAENALTSDLVGNLNASGYSGATYAVISSGTTCDASLTYGAMPKSNHAALSVEGTYKVCVRLADAADNLTFGASSALVVDRTAPSFTSIDRANDASDGYVNASEHGTTNDLVSNLIAAGHDTAAYALAANATTCDGALTYNSAVPKNNAGEFGADGSYKVCVKLTDNAGNPAAYGASAAFILDTIAPVFTSLDLLNEASDALISQAERSATGDLAGNLVATSFDSDSYKLVANSSSCDGSLTYGSMPKTNSSDFGGDGTYKICIKLVDTAQNTTYASSSAITLDTMAPAFTSLDLINDASDTYINDAEHAANNDLAGNLNASGYDQASYKLVTAATTCDGALTYGVMPKGSSSDFGADGSYKICVKLSDNSGNETFADGPALTLDVSLPTFTSIDLASDAADNFISAAERSAANDLVDNLNGSGYDAAAYALVAGATTCDHTLTYGAVPKSNSADFGADGAYKVCIRLTDVAGNPAAYGASSPITLDATSPVFTAIDFINDAADGYINAVERSSASDLAGNLNAANYSTDLYKLVTAATTCNNLLTYNSMPKSNSADFGSDGSYKICIKLEDAAGNISFAESANLALDTTAPSFSSLDLLHDALDGVINTAERSTANDLAGNLNASNHDTAAYKLAPLATTCDGALTYGAMPKSNSADFGADGDYKICAKLTDDAGNPAAYGNSSTFNLDTTAPVFTSIDLLNDAADGYINTTERSAANDLAGNLNASGHTGAAYKLVAAAVTCDGALTYGTMPQSNSGDFGADNSYKICIKLIDAANNITYANSSNFSLDTASPTFTSLDLINDNTDAYINASEHSAATDLGGNLVGSNYDTAAYKLVTSATACNHALTYGAMPQSDSADFGANGSYKICIELADLAGNKTYGASNNFTLDTDVPAFTSLDLTNDAADSYINISERSNTNNLTSNLVATGHITASYKLVTTATTCDGGLTYGSIPKSNSADFGADGSYKICVKLTDNAGNTPAYGASNSFTLDTQPPVFNSVDLANDAADGYLNTAERSAANDLGTNLNASGYDTVAYKLAANATACNSSLTYGAMPKSNSSDLSGDGQYKICLKLTDTAGNVTYGASIDFLLDATTPSFTSLDLANDAADGYINASENGMTNDLAGNLVASGHDSATYALVSAGTTCNGGLTYAAMPKSNSGDFSGDGSYKICVKVIDLAGNTPAYGSSTPFTLDTAAPGAFTINAPLAAATLMDNTPTLSWSAAAGADEYDLKIASSSGCASPSQSYTALAVTSRTLTVLGDGTWFVCLRALDAAGNYTPASNDDLSFTISTGVWSAMNAANAPTARQGATNVWDTLNSRMIVWGGFNSSVPLNTGSQYHPMSNTWTLSNTADPQLPEGRFEHTAVWTGSRMIIWGGSNGAAALDTGAIFKPAGADYWSEVSLSGAPTPRQRHTAVWSGSEMIVFGGSNGSSTLGDGASYDLSGDSWIPLDTNDPNLPSAREGHTAIWTGSKMIVFGGKNGGTAYANGGIYDPSLPDGSRWSPLSAAGAPAARHGHTAVWTGTYMIVFGGQKADGSYLNSGSLYNPANDTWTSMAMADAPAIRGKHVAAYDQTSEKMFIFGGVNSGGYLSSGGVYSSNTNSWVVPAMNAASAPSARQGATGIFAEGYFLIFGGFNGTDLSNGFKFSPP